MLTFFQQPWPWYITGPLIGLIVPILLILGNKSFGISSSLRHICAACTPNKIPFFDYDWRKETWNLVFILGLFLGGMIAASFLTNNEPIAIHPDLVSELNSYGITNVNSVVPEELMNWENIFTLKGFLIIVVGGGD